MDASLYSRSLLMAALATLVPVAAKAADRMTSHTSYAFDHPSGTLDSVDFRIAIAKDPGNDADVAWGGSAGVNRSTPGPSHGLFAGVQTRGRIFGDRRTLFLWVPGVREVTVAPSGRCVFIDGGTRCEVPYAWQAWDSVNLRFASEGDQRFAVTAFVDRANGDPAEFKLGSVRLPGAAGLSRTGLRHWVEYPVSNPADCERLPYSVAAFDNPWSGGDISKVTDTGVGGACQMSSRVLRTSSQYVGSLHFNALGSPQGGLVVSRIDTSCLDAQGGARPGAPIITYECKPPGARANQLWTYTWDLELRLPNNLCLDVAGAIAPGSPVIAYYCHWGSNQRWELDRLAQGGYRLHPWRASDLCLTAGRRDQPLTIERCIGGAGNANQTWVAPFP